VNRKVLFVVLVLAVVLLATPYVGMVSAGKGQERLSIMLDVGTYATGTESTYKIWNSPKKVELPEYTRVLHVRGSDWGDPATHAGFGIVVDEAGLDIEFDNEDIAYSNSYDAEFRNVLYGQEALPYIIMHIRVSERWEIDNGDYVGYIEILTVDIVYDYMNLYEGIHGSGSFVGHGLINGQNIKLSGETELDGTASPIRTGTVMGWPA